MEWESLESAMALWSPSVLAAEHRLCARKLEPLPLVVWPECFAKIATRIVAAFFRFADGVAAAAREPQWLFKLLDMLDAVVRQREHLDELFSRKVAVFADKLEDQVRRHDAEYKIPDGRPPGTDQGCGGQDGARRVRRVLESQQQSLGRRPEGDAAAGRHRRARVEIWAPTH